MDSIWTFIKSLST
jgi:hypothetical protein